MPRASPRAFAPVLLALVLVYLLHGLGRAAFESVNRALTADLFRDRSAAAFANGILQNALGTALGFVLFPKLPVAAVVALCALPAAAAIPASLVAADRARQRTHGHEARASPPP